MSAGAEIDVRADLARIFREEAGSVTSVLARRTGDFALAEECVQDALVRALECWPRDGIPARPGAWLMTVARNRALDRLRRNRVEHSKLLLVEPSARHPDDRLDAIFTCCHPALAREAQLALTLQAVCGFTTAQIAGALLCSEAAVAQRVSRARRKITGAKITFRSPEPEDLDRRLAEVLAVVYLMFNEGYLSAGGTRSSSRDLTEDAAWLASLLVGLYPREPEPAGLLALMWLHLARAPARFDADGELVLLEDQDRSLWDRVLIGRAVSLLERAAGMDRVGPYQLQAAIAACHAQACRFADTDWAQILTLYDLLLTVQPSPIVRLNRAVVVGQVHGAEAALAEVGAVADALDGYHLLHAIRGQLLHELGDQEQAHAAQQRAEALTANIAEQSLLRRRIEHIPRKAGGSTPRMHKPLVDRRSGAQAVGMTMNKTSFMGDKPVNRIGFGAMQLAGPGVFGPPRDPDAARAVLRRAIELGVDHIDTAQYYGPDVVNDLIRDSLYPYPDNLKLVTKVGGRRDDRGAWLPAQTPAELRAGVEDNLRSLRVERMDLVNLRLMTADTDGEVLAEQLGALEDLRREGKLDLIGISEADAGAVRRALDLVDIAEVQNAYSVVNRSGEAVLDLCIEREIAFVPYFPLGSAFSGGPKQLAQDPAIAGVAERRGITPTQVALAWLLSRYERMLLIPGTSSVAHLEENLAAIDVELDEQDLAELENAAQLGDPLAAAHD